MGNDISDLGQADRSGRLVLPSLVFSRFSAEPSYIVTSILLLDIAATFGTPVGIAGQMRTTCSVVSFLSALAVSVLSIRFRHRSLLLVGLFFVSLSALGSAFAPSFETLLATYLFVGLGSFVVTSMVNTLVAEYFPLEKRASILGWTVSGVAAAYLVGPPIIGVIAGIGGWRLAFLGYALPLALIGLVFGFLGLPMVHSGLPSQKSVYSESLRRVLTNRSAVSCLIGSALCVAAFQFILTYSAAFLREQFHVSVGFVSVYFLFGSASYIIGSLLAARLVHRLGRKRSTVIPALLAGFFFVMAPSISSLYISIAFSYIGALFAGLRITAATSLTLEQVPALRGTTMSLDSAAIGAGSALGTGLGGAVLLVFNYQILGLVLGSMSIAGGILIRFLAHDPTL